MSKFVMEMYRNLCIELDSLDPFREILKLILFAHSLDVVINRK